MYYVYILTNRNKNVLYIGVTNNLTRRTSEHKEGLHEGFAERYKTLRLVYAEEYRNVKAAIAREKQLKGWRHAKKVALIESLNPEWENFDPTLEG